MARPLNVAIAGATGLVGRGLLEALAERDFPAARLHALASDRSLGETVDFRARSQAVNKLEEFDFTGCDLAFFCTPAEVSAQHVPRARAQGSSVIDLSRAFREREDVPLVVAGVNDSGPGVLSAPALICTPEAPAVMLATVLAPLRSAGLRRIDVALYLAASCGGRGRVEALARESIAVLSGRGASDGRAGAAPLAFTCSAQIGAAGSDGYTPLEQAVAAQLRRVLGEPDLNVNVTAAGVPVFYGDGAAVHVDTREPLTAAQARKLLETAPGVTLVAAGTHTVAANRDTVYVARIRDDQAPGRGLNLWAAGDGVRFGGAGNSVRIAEALARCLI